MFVILFISSLINLPMCMAKLNHMQTIYSADADTPKENISCFHKAFCKTFNLNRQNPPKDGHFSGFSTVCFREISLFQLYLVHIETCIFITSICFLVSCCPLTKIIQQQTMTNRGLLSFTHAEMF